MIFGKDLQDIKLPDVEAFFSTEREETDKLEFKSSPETQRSNNSIDEQIKVILKTICAFSNSEGGLLIWGAPAEKSGSSVCIGSLLPLGKEFKRDQLIAKIANSIIPSPQGVRFLSIPKEDKFIYIIEVPKSEYSPHQYDNRYFMRMDGQTKPAPHHLIEALFKKISFPNIEAFLKIEGYSKYNDEVFTLRCSVIFRNVSPFQNEYDLHYRVFSSQGVITGPGTQIRTTISGSDLSFGGDFQNPHVTDTLYYGNWIDDKFTIILNKPDLQRIDNALSIRIQFGAKTSPMKISIYTLNLTDEKKEKPFDYIVEMIENRLFTTLEEDMNMPSIDRLRLTLGR